VDFVACAVATRSHVLGCLTFAIIAVKVVQFNRVASQQLDALNVTWSTIQDAALFEACGAPRRWIHGVCVPTRVKLPGFAFSDKLFDLVYLSSDTSADIFKSLQIARSNPKFVVPASGSVLPPVLFMQGPFKAPFSIWHEGKMLGWKHRKVSVLLAEHYPQTLMELIPPPSFRNVGSPEQWPVRLRVLSDIIEGAYALAAAGIVCDMHPSRMRIIRDDAQAQIRIQSATRATESESRPSPIPCPRAVVTQVGAMDADPKGDAGLFSMLLGASIPPKHDLHPSMLPPEMRGTEPSGAAASTTV